MGPHLADQLALPMALAVWQSGRAATYTCSAVTEHTRTHLAVIERFVPVRTAIERVGERGWRVALAPAD